MVWLTLWVVVNIISGLIISIDGDQFEVAANNKVYKFERGEFTPFKAPAPIEYFRIGKCRCELDQQIEG